MIPDRDYYADKHGRLTDDPTQYAQQIGVRGCILDERVARRYGITDTLVSTGEPNAVRRVSHQAPIQIKRTEDQVENAPQEPADAAEPQVEEPEAEKPKTEAKKPAAKKEKK